VVGTKSNYWAVRFNCSQKSWNGAQTSKDSYRQLTHCSDVVSIKLKLCDCIAAIYCSGKAYQWNLVKVSTASAEQAFEREIERDRETDRERRNHNLYTMTQTYKRHIANTRTLVLAYTCEISQSLNSTYHTDSNGMVAIYFLVYTVTLS